MDFKAWFLVTATILSNEYVEGKECKETVAGEKYNGTINVTQSGNKCQRWDAQYPHSHNTNEMLPGSLQDHKNYCRNPNGEILPWCYTVEKDVRKEFCDIPLCDPSKECKETSSGREYRGTMSHTNTLIKCQRWDSQTPHVHHRDRMLPGPASSHENYCRNPDGENFPWCYTTDIAVRWHFCDIPLCESLECKKTEAGLEYRGTQSFTAFGLECERWDKQKQNSQEIVRKLPGSASFHHNYCRNPDNSSLPWCYTKNRNITRQHCNIRTCSKTQSACYFNVQRCEWTFHNTSLWQREDDENDRSFIKLIQTPGDLSKETATQILISPPFTASVTARCLTIDYYSKGTMLSIGILPSKNLQDLEESGSWRSNRILIPASAERYKIAITAKLTLNASHSSYDIKIDNIIIKDEKCHDCFQCLTGSLCIPSSKFCDLIPDCPDASDEVNCSMECSIDDVYMGHRNKSENGLECSKYQYTMLEGTDKCAFNTKGRPWCNTKSVSNWDYCNVPKCDTGILTCEFENSLCNWKMNRRKPQYDLDSGSVILALPIQVYNNSEDNQTILYSAVQPAVNEIGCITFAYSMEGAGTLSVYISPGTILGEKELLFHRRDIDTGGFQEANIMTPIETPYMVFFKAVANDSQYSKIRISKITYNTGVCKETQSCGVGRYRCNDGSCINVHNLCDFHYDCTDKSDETNCYMDCYFPLSYSYKGTANTTVEGIPCQRWDKQSPHTHTFIDLGNEENYCRITYGSSEPWCFTTDSNVRNQTCGIRPCSYYGDCIPFWDLKGATYTGNVAKTRTGHSCQRWDQQTPHRHRFPNLEENYCRNPDSEPQPWCYTTDKMTRYELCDVPICRFRSCHDTSLLPTGTLSNICKYRKHQQHRDFTNVKGGTFECFDTPYAIPREEVCDGFPQCPLADDEFPCFNSCPRMCTCNGLIYKCTSPIHIPKNARVIDLSMTSVDTNDFTVYPHLVNLNLSYCSLADVTRKAFFGVHLGAVNLQSLDLSFNNISHIGESAFARLPNMLSLNLSGNNFHILSLSWFSNMNSLRELVIQNSNIELVTSRELKTNYDLQVLDLSKNRIYKIAFKTLHDFVSLTNINLSNNRLTDIDCYFSQKMNKLYELDLSFNAIRNISDLTFSELGMLRILKIRNNHLTRLISHSFSSCMLLEELDIGNNKIQFIEKKALINLKSLNRFNLTNNNLVTLTSSRFLYLISLVTLDLTNNKLKTLDENAFEGLDELKYLYIDKNDLNVRQNMFKGMCNLEWLWTDSYTLCCAKPLSVQASKCIAPDDRISSCEQLIDVGILGTLIWFMAVFSVSGNIYVLYYRLRGSNVNISQGYFIINLSISDLLMGIYLWIISFTDLRYRNVYGYKDFEWRHSSDCTIAGILATVSSEASVMFVLLITVERYIALKYPLSSKKITGKIARILSFFAWLFSFFLSTFPLFLYDDFYAHSTVCISLPLTNEKWNGSEYSTFVFIGLNFSLFIAIILGQLLIFREVKKIGNKVTNDTTAREIAVFKSLSYVVLSDTFCWIPVGIAGLMALSGVQIPVNIYAWMIVVVLPVNSALNPFIYTYSAIVKRKKQKNWYSQHDQTTVGQLRKWDSCQKQINPL